MANPLTIHVMLDPETLSVSVQAAVAPHVTLMALQAAVALIQQEQLAQRLGASSPSVVLAQPGPNGRR